MRPPEFTLFPWKLMALAVPAMGAVGAGVAAQYSREPVDILSAFFGVVAAGNAYVFAMAIGDFGRSVLAIPIGAAAGFVSVRIFLYPLVDMAYLLFLGIYAAAQLRGAGKSAMQGCLAFGLVVLFFLFGACRTGPGGDVAAVCAFATFPFVCSCVTAAMPLENNLEAFRHAFMAGTSAGLYGLGAGGVAYLGVLSVSMSVLGLFSTGVPQETAYLIAAVGGSFAANYFCVKHVFDSVHRVEAPVERRAPAEQPAAEPPPQIAPRPDEQESTDEGE